jgi:ketosteroid isomerase-like protein
MHLDTSDVAKANEAFYKAFESLDIKRMEGVWAKANYIQCVHPGWRLLRGWEPVMNSWRRIFENTQEMHFVLTEVSIQIRGSCAWVTLYENIGSPVDGEIQTGVVSATNILEKGADGWQMIHHQGSSVLQHPPQFNPSTVH